MAAREREKTRDFKQEYAQRAGIEGTLSRGIRTCGLRCSRYVGHTKVHLGNVLTATALNLLRIGEWLLVIGYCVSCHSDLALCSADSSTSMTARIRQQYRFWWSLLAAAIGTMTSFAGDLSCKSPIRSRRCNW